MADEQEVSVSAHEHIEPNILNVLLILAVLLVGLALLRAGVTKYPNLLGGLSGIVGQ